MNIHSAITFSGGSRISQCGHNFRRGAQACYFPKKTVENCTKMKEFGPQGEGEPRSIGFTTDLKLVDNFKIEALA